MNINGKNFVKIMDGLVLKLGQSGNIQMWSFRDFEKYAQAYGVADSILRDVKKEVAQVNKLQSNM